MRSLGSLELPLGLIDAPLRVGRRSPGTFELALGLPERRLGRRERLVGGGKLLLHGGRLGGGSLEALGGGGLRP